MCSDNWKKLGSISIDHENILFTNNFQSHQSFQNNFWKIFYAETNSVKDIGEFGEITLSLTTNI